MINPANYYNPFAKYNYVSKTRGAYIPQDANLNANSSNLWTDSSVSSEKTTNIWSDNYDAELDINQSLSQNDDAQKNSGILGIFKNLFE